ncbi:MAG: hypothetical protein NC416_06200 [Eubacterium sp.]|nr:hypothetical protein [Eubacterium sp.]
MKSSYWKWLFIVPEALLLMGFVVLAFLEKDYRASVEIIISMVAIVLEIVACKWDKCWFHVVIIIVLCMVDVIWVRGIWLNTAIKQKIVADNKLAENPDSFVSQDKKEETMELDLKEDPLLKSLNKYTNDTATNQEKMKDVITKNIRTWMTGWDSLTLGEASAEYTERRGKVDEIYIIRCLPEADSIYLQDEAISDYDKCITELEALYKIYTNPQIIKEEAEMYLEKGDLCQRLGRESEASTAYHEAIGIAERGVEESIKYGMSTNAKEILDILCRSYAGMKVLGAAEDEWDRKRAQELENVFGELKNSFDNILKEEIKKR